MAGCNASYVGYTTCALEKRAQQHRYSSSSINKHHTTEHQDNSAIPNNFKECFSILHSYNNKIDLKIVEALEIKHRKPYINVKFNECSNYFNIYK
jgi:hypothetical protein